MMNDEKQMSFMEKLVAEQLEKKRNTTMHDFYDNVAFHSSREECHRLREIEKNKEEYPPLPNLMQDLFYQFFKYNPQFYDDDKIEPECLPNKEIIKKAMKNENWRKMREMTKLDEANSIIATLFFSEHIIEEMKKRDEKFMKEMEKLKEKKEELINKIKEYTQAGSNEAKNSIEQEIESLKTEIFVNAKKASNMVSQFSVSATIKKATEKMKDFFDSANAISWGNETKELSFSDPREKIKLANFFMKNENFAKIIKEIGRLKNILVETRRQKIKHGTDEIYSVETGAEIRKVLPAELVRLKNPVLKKDFMKKLANRELLQYQLQSKEKKGKGNMIVCLDMSGSMSGHINTVLPVLHPEKPTLQVVPPPIGESVSKSVYAKALALAALEIAIRENRTYHLMFFETHVRNMKTFSKNNRPTVDDILEIASYEYGGGTNFERPLKEAMKIMDKKTDILLITDGECDVSENFLLNFNTEKKNLGARVISLQVGTCDTKPLEKFSDVVYNYTHFIETSKKVFESLLEERGGK